MIKRILAIIVDYHSTPEAEYLSLQLSKYSKSSSLSVHILHVDNGNFPPVLLSESQIQCGIRHLSTGSNLGYAGALNFAVRELKSTSFDAYWFLNSDLEVGTHCLDSLVKVLDGHPEVGAIGPIVWEFPHTHRVWGARGIVSPWLGTTAMSNWKKSGALPRWSYIPGCSLLVRAEAYTQAGGLPEHYKLYFEETEFCIRLQKMGWTLWVETEAHVYHKVFSMKGRIPARHFAYYFTRNNLAFWKSNFSIPVWLQFPRTLYVVIREVILPLRRAKRWVDVWDRLKFVFAGLIDGVLFAKNRPMKFESRLFTVDKHRS